MYLKGLGEDALVKGLAERFGGTHPRLLKGIGDDTSVAIERPGMAMLATTDILIEGTHFTRTSAPPELLGRKSLSVSLSDIAAMGGVPLFYLVSIALPPDTTKKFLDGLYSGLRAAAEEYGCALAGGNTARIKGPMMVSTTVLGEVPADEVVYRQGANAGDLIFVTGTLGDSALGLKALKERGPAALRRGPYKKAAKKHLDPEPRLKAGREIARTRLATSMMDISDGLGVDLKRLCLESGKTAVVSLSALPVSGELTRHLKDAKKTILIDLAFAGGEDYELLFTSPEANLKKIISLSRRLGLRITPVGRIVAKKKGAHTVTLIGEDGRPVRPGRLGYVHF